MLSVVDGYSSAPFIYLSHSPTLLFTHSPNQVCTYSSLHSVKKYSPCPLRNPNPIHSCYICPWVCSPRACHETPDADPAQSCTQRAFFMGTSTSEPLASTIILAARCRKMFACTISIFFQFLLLLPHPTKAITISIFISGARGGLKFRLYSNDIYPLLLGSIQGWTSFSLPRWISFCVFESFLLQVT